MKWVFAFLLAANLALFMWGSWYHTPLVDPGPRPAPGVAEEKLRLLSEPGVRLTLRAREEAGGPAAPPGGDGADCYRLGPFPTPEAAQAAGGKLDAWNLDYERTAELETRRPVYRVYLPPFPSKTAAERKRREIARLGFTDHAVIQEEGMENAVSLGVFAVEQNARERAAQLAAKGIEALIRPIPQVQPVYWLVLAADEVSGEPLARLRAADWGSAGIRPRRASCRPPRPSSKEQPAADQDQHAGERRS